MLTDHFDVGLKNFTIHKDQLKLLVILENYVFKVAATNDLGKGPWSESS